MNNNLRLCFAADKNGINGKMYKCSVKFPFSVPLFFMTSVVIKEKLIKLKGNVRCMMAKRAKNMKEKEKE